MLSEVFWIAFISTVSGLMIKLCSMAFKSKCSEFSACCFTVKRNVDIEEREHEFDVEHKVGSFKDEKM